MRRDFAEDFCVVAEDIPCGVGEATTQKSSIKDRAGMSISLFYRVLAMTRIMLKRPLYLA